ncbi:MULTISPECIES: DUF721 domain-containing protein [Photorhabdus]|uniref:DUF721 domain-containing protein n=2 Tax=Photorhabdus TaxID=29487 RepID=A0ABX0B7Z3_9GAMM|nr:MULTISPECIES: DUF721 domain-containing protein [Photorhabdus]MCC8373086.1 DUF721 domain-containing protein [Photorhabdus bodei]MCT8351575.1 DUF721 domain-containing protein [Photorhabdus kayaii]MDB6367343.1 DUF721 domain-containing protein [Photorhabdus bodei]MDB6372761.1 DUF721 domain-containing protein [Photorhabdus bodei]NDL13216.1 DUF721 domain-containing protein [Photorhabdus kayaii]
MRDSRPQSLDVLFEDAAAVEKSPLHVIQQRAFALLKLNRAVVSLLPAQLHPWCRVANYRKQILVLEAGNASWMTRLRYELPTLLSTLRSEILPSLSSIDIRINPSLMIKHGNSAQSFAKTMSDEHKTLPTRQLSQESAKELIMLANRSPKKLKERLERLAALAGESASTAKTTKR